MNDLPLLFSLFSLGFFGGFTHCIGMCGPFVLTQASNRLENIPIENFSHFKKLQNLALIPYHLGRITTYSIIGIFCSILTTNLDDFAGFRMISAILLIIAAFIFIHLFFEGKVFNKIKIPSVLRNKIRLPFNSKILKKALSFLFANPRGLKGYTLGLILGFLPCGLLYAAFAIIATISNPAIAAIGMIIFGISTFPSLFFTAFGGQIFSKIPEFKLITKIVILINITILILMAFKLAF